MKPPRTLVAVLAVLEWHVAFSLSPTPTTTVTASSSLTQTQTQPCRITTLEIPPPAYVEDSGFTIVFNASIVPQPRCRNISLTWTWSCFIPRTNSTCSFASLLLPISGPIPAVSVPAGDVPPNEPLELTATVTPGPRGPPPVSRTWAVQRNLTALVALLSPLNEYQNIAANVSLSAALSYDPLALDPPPLYAFSWSACKWDIVLGCVSSGGLANLLQGATTTGATLRVPPLFAYQGQNWRITVTYTHSYTLRTSQASHILRIIGDLVPSVTLDNAVQWTGRVDSSLPIIFDVAPRDAAGALLTSSQVDFTWLCPGVTLAGAALPSVALPALGLAAYSLTDRPFYTCSLNVSLNRQPLQIFTIPIKTHPAPVQKAPLIEPFVITNFTRPDKDLFTLSTGIERLPNAIRQPLEYRYSFTFSNFEFPLTADPIDTWRPLLVTDPLSLTSDVTVPAIRLPRSDLDSTFLAINMYIRGGTVPTARRISRTAAFQKTLAAFAPQDQFYAVVDWLSTSSVGLSTLSNALIVMTSISAVPTLRPILNRPNNRTSQYTAIQLLIEALFTALPATVTPAVLNTHAGILSLAIPLITATDIVVTPLQVTKVTDILRRVSASQSSASPLTALQVDPVLGTANALALYTQAGATNTSVMRDMLQAFEAVLGYRVLTVLQGTQPFFASDSLDASGQPVWRGLMTRFRREGGRGTSVPIRPHPNVSVTVTDTATAMILSAASSGAVAAFVFEQNLWTTVDRTSLSTSNTTAELIPLLPTSPMVVVGLYSQQSPAPAAISNASTLVRIVFSYPNPPANLRCLYRATVNGTDLWSTLGVTTDRAATSVTCSSNHFSVFTLGVAAVDGYPLSPNVTFTPILPPRGAEREKDDITKTDSFWVLIALAILVFICIIVGILLAVYCWWWKPRHRKSAVVPDSPKPFNGVTPGQGDFIAKVLISMDKIDSPKRDDMALITIRDPRLITAGSYNRSVSAPLFTEERIPIEYYTSTVKATPTRLGLLSPPALDDLGALHEAQDMAVSEQARNKLQLLRPKIGISVEDTDEGVLVVHVVQGSAADICGIVEGDLIAAFNDVPIERVLDYSVMANQCVPGTQIRLRVLRNGVGYDSEVIVGAQISQSQYTTLLLAAAREGRTRPSDVLDVDMSSKASLAW